MIGLSTYGHCQAEHALEEGGQEVAPSQGALAGEAGHCQGCSKAPCPPGGRQRAQEEEGREHPGAAQKTAQQQGNKEATRLLIQPPLVSTLVKRMCAPRAPSATVKAKATLTGEAAPAEEYPSPRSAVKKPEATQKRRRQLPRSRLAALPAVPAKVNPLEAFGPLFGGKPKPAARVAKLAPVPKLTARRPRRQRRIRRHRSQWRPHPRRPRSSQR